MASADILIAELPTTIDCQFYNDLARDVGSKYSHYFFDHVLHSIRFGMITVHANSLSSLGHGSVRISTQIRDALAKWQQGIVYWSIRWRHCRPFLVICLDIRGHVIREYLPSRDGINGANIWWPVSLGCDSPSFSCTGISTKGQLLCDWVKLTFLLYSQRIRPS